MAKFKYEVSGHGGKGQPFVCTGYVECDFHMVLDRVMVGTFESLTQGKAEFGHPGEGGCTGPYDIREFYVEKIDELH